MLICVICVNFMHDENPKARSLDCIATKNRLWGSSGGSRADIAVGFSQLILVAFLLTRRPFNQQGSSGILLGRFPAILVSLLWSGLLITFFVIMTTFFVGFNGQSRVFSYVVALLVIFLTGVSNASFFNGISLQE